jgi:hypothetical protein
MLPKRTRKASGKTLDFSSLGYAILETSLTWERMRLTIIRTGSTTALPRPETDGSKEAYCCPAGLVALESK